MHYKRTILACVAAIALVGAIQPALAQEAIVAEGVEDIVSTVVRSFGTEVAEDGGTAALRASMSECAERYGVAATKQVFETVGPEAGVLLRQVGPAGEDMAFALLRQNGEQAVRVLADSTSRELVEKYGVEAGDAMIAHPGVAEDVIAREGAPAIQAMNKLDNPDAIRLARLSKEGLLDQAGDSKGLLGVVGKYGNRAVEYIGQHKAALITAAGCAAFVAHPKVFLDAAGKVAGGVVREVARLIISRLPWKMITAIVLTGIGLWWFGPRLVARLWRARAK